MMKLSVQHFFSFEEHEEEEGKLCVHHWKHFPISCLEEEEEEEEEEEIHQIWFKKTNLGIVVGKDHHFGLQLLLIKKLFRSMCYFPHIFL